MLFAVEHLLLVLSIALPVLGSIMEEDEVVRSSVPTDSDIIAEDSITMPQPHVLIDSRTNDDFVEILNEIIKEQKLEFQLEYFLSNFNLQELLVRVYIENDFGKEHIIYQYVLEISPSTREKVTFQVDIPESAIYFDWQNTHMPTNYFVKQLSIRVSNSGGVEPISLKDVPLPPPWSRNDLPRYSSSWLLDLKKILWKKLIPTCQMLSEPTLFASVLPLMEKADGFVKKLPPLILPRHARPHYNNIVFSSTRFTVTFWLYMLKDCPLGMCMILQHRNSSHFFTPIVLLNSEGKFHVQLHNSDGSGYAFVSNEAFPLHKWLHLVLVVNINTADLYVIVDDGRPVKHYRHIASQEVHFNASDGVWVAGGHSGSHSFKGYIAYVQVYQNTVISLEHILKFRDVTRQKLKSLKFEDHYRQCKLWRRVAWKHVLKKPTKRLCQAELPYALAKTARCPIIQHHMRSDIHPQMLKQLQILLKGRNATSKTNTSLRDLGKLLYNSMQKEMLKDALTKSLISRLFSLSGCLGHLKGFHMSAVMFKYGLGLEVDPAKAIREHLLGCVENSALSQLALAYRHQLGVDGLSKDADLMTGYLRNVARSVELSILLEEQTIHTPSEMIRLDQAHLFRDVRGADSELFSWLSQQAKMGSLDAKTKVAEMLFHGKQGLNVDRGQALQYYEMAAEAGDPNAIFNVGVIHLKGVNTEKNETKAFEYFRRAAKLNSSVAYNSLGYIELVHNNNRSGAMYYWNKSVSMDNADGMTNYASLLENGLQPGDPPNKLAAFDLYRKAAKRGQKTSCIRAADYLIDGSLVTRDVKAAAQYLRYVTELSIDVGFCMRDAIDSYAAGHWYKSVIHHLLATEAGVQLAGYNTALLLREYQADATTRLNISDPYYYFNLSAEMGWSLSLVEMGHHKWFSMDVKKASDFYARSVQKDNNPEALYNLGYIVEHSYPIHEHVRFANVASSAEVHGNLTFASLLYQSCIESQTESGEGYFPCSLAYMKVKLKALVLRHQQVVWVSSSVSFFLLLSLVTVVTLLR